MAKPLPAAAEPEPEWTPLGSVTFWALLMGVSRNTMAKLLKSGAIRSRRLGGQVQIDAAMLPACHRAAFRRPFDAAALPACRGAAFGRPKPPKAAQT